MANTYLSFSPQAGTSQKIFTFSLWFKRGKLGTSQWLVEGYGGGSFNTSIYLSGGNALVVFDEASSTTVATSRLFRDTNAWYNAVVAVDTTQSTASDRIKIYINGVQETSFSSSNYPAQNSNFYMTGNVSSYYIGKRHSGDYFDGSISHVHQVDGIAYVPTTFGEYDANGVWKIKTSPTVSEYGNNGYFILKDGNSVTDQSGKGNNWTVGGGTLTKTEDCPSNVFATLNTLAAPGSSIIFNKGNTQIYFGAGGYHAVYSTIGATSGKYYAECLVDAVGSGSSIGIISADTVSNVQETGDGDYMGKESDSIGYVRDGEMYKANNLQQTIATYTTNDIISLAFDLDNNSIQFYKNGSSVGNTVSLTANKTYMIGGSGYGGSRLRWNFGNGYFGTTAVSSAGTNASGIGIFEYDVPTGFTALSTKGLNL